MCPALIHLNPDLVRELTTDPAVSRYEAQRLLGVSESRLLKEMHALGIPVEPTRKRPYARSRVRKDIPEQTVRELLVDQGLTQDAACEILNCGNNCLRRLIRKYQIPTQRVGPRSGPGHHHSWKGGRIVDKDGYILLYRPDHPHARGGKYVLEHRLIMEAHLGRYLAPEEVVHHKDVNHQNNEWNNLELFATNADHLRHELTGRSRIPNSGRRTKTTTPLSLP